MVMATLLPMYSKHYTCTCSFLLTEIHIAKRYNYTMCVYTSKAGIHWQLYMYMYMYIIVLAADGREGLGREGMVVVPL